jgi:hypothetical protein
MTNPKNYLVNLRFAEILYASTTSKDRLGDLVNARKYFSHAAVLKEGDADARTLFGLLKTCQAIEKLIKKPDEKNTEVLSVTKKQIKELYERKT